MHGRSEPDPAGEPVRAERDSFVRGVPRHCTASADAAPLADIGLDEAQVAGVDRLGECRLPAQVLAGGQWRAGVRGKLLPGLNALVGGDRLFDPMQLERRQRVDLGGGLLRTPRLVGVDHDGGSGADGVAQLHDIGSVALA